MVNLEALAKELTEAGWVVESWRSDLGFPEIKLSNVTLTICPDGIKANGWVWFKVYDIIRRHLEGA